MNAHQSNTAFESHLHPILGSLRLTGAPYRDRAEPTPVVLPFVTISRQAGAGGTTLAQRLVERLNAADPDAERPWTCWDRELVERVAGDHHISQALIDSLEDVHRTWLEDFFAGLSFDDAAEQPDELVVYHRVAATVRALAQHGRVVVVGRGGVCITRSMPGGVHVRLVAPQKHRVAFMMRKFNVSQDVAAEQVRQLDRNRELFYRRYWPTHPLAAEMFTVTLNTADLAENQLVECLLPLIVGGEERRLRSGTGR
jgi:cytidylate kinase